MKVFTSKEIAGRRFPKDDAQVKVTKILESWLEVIYKWQSTATLSAAVLIGSSARGEATITSDMDVLLFLEDGHKFKEGRAELRKVPSKLRKSIRQEFSVPLEFWAVLRSQMEPGQTRYDKQYLRHAVSALEWDGLLCGRAEAVKEFHELAPPLSLPTALIYIDRKVAKAHTALSELDLFDCDDDVASFLADLASSPFHALRRVFTLANVPYVDNKSGLISSLRDIGDELTEENLKFLQKLADSYGDHVTQIRDEVPAIQNPFDAYGAERVAEEFFSSLGRIRVFAVITGGK